MSRALRAGDRGLDVYQWQAFLQGRGDPLRPVGAFDEPTVSATRRFQSVRGLAQTGEADEATLDAARALGLVLVDYWADDPGYPALPDFGPLTDNASRMALFGAFEFAPAPRPDNPEAIRFRDDWADRQLVTVELAQLSGLPGAPADGRVRFHRRAAAALIGLWQAWDDAGLLDRIARFDGAFEPRFKRGRTAQGESVGARVRRGVRRECRLERAEPDAGASRPAWLPARAGAHREPVRLLLGRALHPQS